MPLAGHGLRPPPLRWRASRPQLKRDPLDGGPTCRGPVALLSIAHIRRFATAIVVGAATGALCLGVGGRLAMHAFALATAPSAGFTVRGSLNVVFAGAIAGAIGGLLLAVIERFLSPRLWLRGVLFGVVCYVIAIPGFRPPQPLVFALFAPAFLAYGVVIAVTWERFVRGRRPTSA